MKSISRILIILLVQIITVQTFAMGLTCELFDSAIDVSNREIRILNGDKAGSEEKAAKLGDLVGAIDETVRGLQVSGSMMVSGFFGSAHETIRSNIKRQGIQKFQGSLQPLIMGEMTLRNIQTHVIAALQSWGVAVKSQCTDCPISESKIQIRRDASSKFVAQIDMQTLDATGNLEGLHLEVPLKSYPEDQNGAPDSRDYQVRLVSPYLSALVDQLNSDLESLKPLVLLLGNLEPLQVGLSTEDVNERAKARTYLMQMIEIAGKAHFVLTVHKTPEILTPKTGILGSYERNAKSLDQ